tara:strand:- start:288 stop:440 length:153 start_codon:yes stop_codon:yes gene_type:complete
MKKLTAGQKMSEGQISAMRRRAGKKSKAAGGAFAEANAASVESKKAKGNS